MLFDKIRYNDDFPINISIARVMEYPVHYHQDVEIIYVLKGEVHLKNMCHHYHLKAGDIFTNSVHEIHGLTAANPENAGQENVVAVIQLSNRFFTRYFPNLQKACFMTYVRDEKHLSLDVLRKMLLHILLEYSRKSFDYKTTCIDQAIDVIKYLNQYFNLFAFDNDIVTNFNNENPVTVGRISRIINHVYENHANKITLKELAEQEHLSTYYLSHLIRDHMGINFKEFLCFARSEMSELLLLGTDRKISAIAKDVGFSTTPYYEKFFTKWYGHSPQEHRQIYTPLVLSAARPAQIEPLSDNQAINILRQCLSAESDQDNSPFTINRLQFSVDIDPQALPVMDINPLLEVVVTMEDFAVMKERISHYLYELNPAKVFLSYRQGTPESETEKLAEKLIFMGYDVSVVCSSELTCGFSAGHDSIAAPIGLFRESLSKEKNILHIFLRDQGDTAKILKGLPSCITSALIPKPSYYAYRFLRNINGKLLYRGRHYYVIKNEASEKVSYTLIAINYNEEIGLLTKRSTGTYEADDIINSFQDELSVDLSIPVMPGSYAIAKYALSNADSIFSHMSNLGFPDSYNLSDSWIRMLNTEPKTQVRVEDVNEMENTLHLSLTVKGAGIQVVVVEEIS